MSKFIKFNGKIYRCATGESASMEDLIKLFHALYEKDKKEYWWQTFILEGLKYEQKSLQKSLKRWNVKYKQLESNFTDYKPLTLPTIDYEELIKQIPVPPELWSLGVSLPQRDV
jgi:hypothetical protein